jgi:regulator of replication initiation timing
MSLYRKIQSIKAQIVDTERLLEMVLDHPLMSEGLIERLNLLKQELEEMPKESFEPKVQLLFSGNAVIGSQGIKSSFVNKTTTPFQEMVKTQVALVRFGRVGKRGQAKKGANTDLYLTALPVGSFGVELSQLQNSDLFDSMDVSNAMKEVMTLIANCSTDDATFESTIEKTPKRNLTNLKKFLQEIVEENSVLKMESGELGIELAKEKIVEAYQRVSSTVDEENQIIINGIFRGLLLDSGKFEIQDEEGKKISGFISEELGEEQLIEYDKTFLNNNCIIHLKIHKTKFKTGNEKIDYELLEIKQGGQ